MELLEAKVENTNIIGKKNPTQHLTMLPYFEEADIAVTICDRDGNVLEMNRQSRSINLKPGEEMEGKNILPCHSGEARNLLEHLLAAEEKHVYTIEKKGKKKLIYQIPWYKDGEYAGFMELSMVIPFEMPHKIRS